MFFAAKNLVSLSMEPCIPWAFQPTEMLTLQIRKCKSDRQEFYQNANTSHQFYTAVEALNPNQRVSKENNPPFKLHGFVADYDVEIPDARIVEIVDSMVYKPFWIETSLGYHRRFVWLLEREVLVQDFGFLSAIYQEAVKWLQLHKAPGLDEQAFITPTRLYCNGCKWEKSPGAAFVPQNDLQAFLVKVGTKHTFRGVAKGEEAIPLAVVEKEIKARFPAFSWPGDFVAGSQGPSFWIPESTSPMSAIVKDGGMISFAAHATKVFNTWSDILGAEFTNQYFKDSIAEATTDIYWDGKCFWGKAMEGDYHARDPHEQHTRFRVDHKLSGKQDDNGVNQIEQAKSYIYNHARIKAAVPVAMRKPGIMLLSGQKILNIYNKTPVMPIASPVAEVWGPHGEFPFLSASYDALLLCNVEQAPHLRAWFYYGYLRAINWAPQPSCYTYLLGGPGTGKTFWNREVFGRSVGGYVDASQYLVEGSSFNSHLFHYPYWALDDDNPSANSATIMKFQAALKKMVANDQHLSNQKFVVSGMTEWRGLIGITGNLDPVSLRIVGTLDNAVLDKTNIFRCVERHAEFKFPSRVEQEKLLLKELPHFLKYIADMQIPAELERHARYELASYQDPALLSQIQQGNPTNPFKEMLLEMMGRYFESKPDEQEWRGNVRDLTSLIMGDPAHAILDRKLDGNAINRHMEKLQREGIVTCSSEEGPMKTRIWIIKRPNVQKPAASTPPPTPNFQ